MKIEILGIGCPKCKQLTENTEAAVKELGLDAEVTKITDIIKITEYGVMMTPGIRINGKIKCSGRIPKLEEIKKWINEEK